MSWEEHEEDDILVLLTEAERGPLESRVEALRSIANTSLVEIPTPCLREALDRLIALGEDPVVQEDALVALSFHVRELARPGEMMPVGYRDRIVDFFIRRSLDALEGTRAVSAGALGTIGKAIPPERRRQVVEHLLRLAAGSSGRVRADAASALGSLGSFLPDYPPFNRIESLIPEDRLAQVVDTLMRLSEDSSVEVGAAAVVAMGMLQETIPPRQRRAVLQRLMSITHDDRPRLVDASVFAITKVYYLIPPESFPTTVERLLELVDHPNAEVRSSAVASFGWISPRIPSEMRPAIVREILSASHDSDVAVRRSVLQNFAVNDFSERIPEEVLPEVVRELLRLARDPDSDLQYSARGSLTYMKHLGIIPRDRKSQVDEFLRAFLSR